MADNQGGTGGTSGDTPTSLMRDYRKGNWTVSETMILIEAKKMDDERRMKRSSGAPNDAVEGGGSGGGGIRINKPAELRWKWVEDYCWRKGCLRSQNQCNDKWDNLMRDYKKVRDYERRLSSSDHDHHDQSYWKIEKNERKEKNLPTNMLPQIYEALVEVVEKKSASHQRVLERTPSSGGGGYNVTPHHERASASVAVSATSTSSLATTIVHQQQQVQASLMASHLAPVILQHHVPAPLPLPAPVPVPVVAPSPVSAVAAVAASPIQAHQPLPYVSQPVLPTVGIFTLCISFFKKKKKIQKIKNTLIAKMPFFDGFVLFS